MKKVLFSLLLLAIAVACGENTFKIKVKVTDADQLPEGAIAYLLDKNGDTVDSVAVSTDSFTFTGTPDTETLYTIVVRYPGKDKRERTWMMPFIPEEGKFNATLSQTEWQMEGDNLTNRFNQFQEDLRALFSEETDNVMEKVKDLSKETIAKNAKNYLALGALQNIIYDLDINELDSLLAQCGSFVSENATIQRIRECKVAEIATAEGNPFVDFAGKTPEGADVRLSDFVGKGKWVLADFWASWCGPCKREIPNIKKTHEALAGDNFTVLGVAVWDGDNSKSRVTMEEMGMTWPQIFVGEDKNPTDSYGIVGIPTMILFAPDGTICKRGDELRGENMLETVKVLINR